MWFDLLLTCYTPRLYLRFRLSDKKKIIFSRNKYLKSISKLKIHNYKHCSYFAEVSYVRPYTTLRPYTYFLFKMSFTIVSAELVCSKKNKQVGTNKQTSESYRNWKTDREEFLQQFIITIFLPTQWFHALCWKHKRIFIVFVHV